MRKARCKHKTEDCDAYIDSELIVLYGDHLYYVEGSGEHASAYYDAKLCRMDLAGSQHEVLCELPVEKPDFAPSATYWQVEATNRYLIVKTVFVGGNAVMKRNCYSFNLDTLESVPLFDDYFQNSDFTDFTIYEGRGSKVYGDICYNDETSYYVIAEVDLSTGAVRELYEHERQFAYYERGVGLWEDKLYLIELNKISQGFYTEEDMQKLYALDINSLELTQVNEEQILIAKYRIFDSRLGYWYSPLYSSGENNSFYVYDMDGNLVDSFLASDCPDGAKSIVIGRITDRYVFGKRRGNYDDNRLPEWYIDKSEIGTGSLMWHKWEP